jgi:NAD(P)H-dependent FMN reductase
MIIISCSLNKQSRSRLLAKAALKISQATLLDLNDYKLPQCDGDLCYENKDVIKLTKLLENENKFIIACPIYNFDVSSPTKNLIELCGDAFEGKTVGLLCASGGKGSFMAPLGLINSLMLDFRCWIVPKFVLADSSCFNKDKTKITDEKINDRISELVTTLKNF